MRGILMTILGGLVALTIAMSAQATDFPVTIEGIDVQGNVEISTKEILGVVPFKSGDEITADNLKAASQAIFDLGWFSEVLPEVDPERVVHFHVVENPIVKKIEITGNITRRPFKLFGFTLFQEPILSSNRIRSLLRTNGVRTGKILNNQSLNKGLEAVLEAYEEKGYALIMLGKVIPAETLQVEIIEGRVTANKITGLVSVPEEVAQAFIDLPLVECVQKEQLNHIMQQLAASVYFSEVSLNAQRGDAPDSFTLIWTLTEQTLIDTPAEVQVITLEGVTKFPIDRAYASLKAIPQQAMDNYRLLQIIEDLHDLYYQAGYVMIRFSVEKIEASTLYLEVEEGKIGEILLEGNDTTKDYVIWKHLAIKQGDILNRAQIAASQQGLMALGYFKSVTPLPKWVDDMVQLTLSIVEDKKLGGINGSLAYSPQSGGLVGKIDYTQKNLFGTGQDLSFSYSRGLIGESSAVWDLGYSTVSFFRDFRRVGFDLYQKREGKTTDEGETQTFYTVGGQASVSYPWTHYIDLTLSYKHEAVRTEEELHWQPIDAIIASLSFNSTDNPRFPTTGARRWISLEQAGGFAAGAQYTKLDGYWAYFTKAFLDLPFPEQWTQVIGVRLALGWGIDLPPSQYYDLGGSNTVRGIDPTTTSHLYYANFEYRLAVVEGLTATLFLDTGVDLDCVTLTNTKASCGVEIGIQAAGMYLRLDVAWPLNPEAGWIPRFDLGFGPMF